MEKEIHCTRKNSTPSLRFLFCDLPGNDTESGRSGDFSVSNPIQCLDRAVDRDPEIIVIHFGEMTAEERNILVELSATLKRNAHTKHCKVLALLNSRHRGLMEELRRAKIDYIRFINDGEVNFDRVRNMINELGPEDRLERQLEVVCPFLHYSRINSVQEMTICGAYLERMVLGGRRLHEICETESHFLCNYYLKPRLAK